MKPDPKKLQELLFRYVEEREGDCVELTQDERTAVDKWLLEDEEACRKAQAIRDHLHFLSDLRSPAIPSDLSALCLDAIQGRRMKHRHSFRKRWAFAGVFAAVVIFLFGLWIGQNQRQPDVIPFLQLARAQTYYIDRLETNLARYYKQTSLKEDNPWFQPIQNLKITSQAISAAYEKHSGDPVIERGLSMALAQNINLLKSLCDYIEDNNAIPDRDVQFFDTTQALSGKSI